MDGYVLGILWSIGSYQEEDNRKYFFLRHKDKYFLDVAQQELGAVSNLHQVLHKGRPQYRLKITGFDIEGLKKLGWQPRWEGQRSYLNKTEHRDFIRAYIEMHSSIDILIIRDSGRNREQKQPRLRIYGNRHFLEHLTEVITSVTGAGIKKVQRAAKSEVSGILYYSSLRELADLAGYLYEPVIRHFYREHYEEFMNVLRAFER